MSETADPALVGVRFLVFGLAMLAFGRSTFALYAPAAAPGRRAGIALGALLTLGALAYAALLARVATGAPGLPDAAAIVDIWRLTGFGRALAVAALAGGALALAELGPRRWRWPRAALAAIALCALAFVGHGVDGVGWRGAARLAAMAVHLLAVAAWLGALPGLWLALAREPALPLVRRFGNLGAACVALMLITGVTMLALIALDAGGTLGGAYVQTLAVKLAFVAGLLVLAAINRWRLTPMMAREPQRARRLLRATIVAEQALGLGALASVALLGQLDTAM